MLGNKSYYIFKGGGGGGGEIRKMSKFNFNEETVEVVWDYKYLGVKLNYNINKFKKAQQFQFSLTNRAISSFLTKCRQLNLLLDK